MSSSPLLCVHVCVRVCACIMYVLVLKRLIGYSVGMALIDSAIHYSIIYYRIAIVSHDEMDEAT